MNVSAEKPRLRKAAKRYAPCRADRVGTCALAHLLATQTPAAHPKQAKEPTFPPATRGRLIDD